MYVIRDIFNLKFGHYKDVKALLDDAVKKSLLPNNQNMKALTDFTGDSYRLIFEQSSDSLTEYEKTLQESMGKNEWQNWYEKFKPHVNSSYREILRQVI